MKGRAVRALCIQPALKTAHLFTAGGTHELETTIRYAPELAESPAYKSPFRPHRVGTHAIRRVEVTSEDILVITDGGTVRLPPEMTTYSFTE